jgi:hypothetical protein
MSAPSQDIAPNPHTNLLNVYIQVANKMGFQQQQNPDDGGSMCSETLVPPHRLHSLTRQIVIWIFPFLTPLSC